MTNFLQRITQIALIAIPTTIGILQFNTLSAIAANRYAVFCIINKTNTTVNYSYQWGKNDWRSTSISPGGERAHYRRYKRANENSSPTTRIRFDSDLRRSRFRPKMGKNYFITYSVKKYAAPEPSCYYGKKYYFEYDGRSKDFIDLKKERN